MVGRGSVGRAWAERGFRRGVVGRNMSSEASVGCEERLRLLPACVGNTLGTMDELMIGGREYMGS